MNHLYKYDASIVLYSVTDRDSFEFARKALQEILPNSKSNLASNKVIILVGNKSDLERSRCVSLLEGRSLATLFDVKFIEISSSLGVGVSELQKGLATQVHLRHAPNSNLNQSSRQTSKKKKSSSSSSNSSTTGSTCSSTSSSRLVTSANGASNKNNRKASKGSSGGRPNVLGNLRLATGGNGALGSLKLAQKLIDRLMLRIGGSSKSKSCLDLHSL